VLLAAPLAASGTADATTTTTEATATVAIGNFTFDPPVLTVPAGTTVTWVNHDDIPHTATSAAKLFGSPVLDTDERFAFRFDRAGSYAYFCKLHPHMSGTVEVTPAPS
jgi:plastocyanin